MKKIIYLILPIIFIYGPVNIASAACSAPTVTATTPTNSATNVPTATPVTITFSAAMQAGTGNNGVQKTGSYTITRTSGTGAIPSVTGVAVDDSTGVNIRTVTLALSGSFGSSSVYKITVSSSVHNSCGSGFSSAPSFSFTTRDEIPPTKCATIPTPSGLSTKNTAVPIQIIFSELMTQGSFDTTSTYTVNDGTSNIPGNISFPTPSQSAAGTCTDTTTYKQVVQFNPSSALQDGKTYTVTVTGVTDQASTPNPMVGSASWFFSVDTTAPAVLPPPTPAVGAYTNTKRPNISVTFTDDMTASTVTTSSFYLKQGSTTIVTTSPSQSGKTFTITPSSDLSSNTQYTVTVKGGIPTCSTCVKDDALNPMSADFVWSFYVDYSPPVVSTPYPASGATNVSIATSISAKIDDGGTPPSSGVDTSTLTSSTFTIFDGSSYEIGTVTYDSGTKLATFAVPGGLKYNTNYTVSLTNGIKDMLGNAITPYSWSFTTEPVRMADFCQVPPYITTPAAPNVLIILDNSNSMDEDMTPGNALGSTATTSRSVIARKALTNIVNKYAGKMRLGLMTYKLPGSVSKGYYLHNNFYFSTYDPKSYCNLDPVPQECSDYCLTDDAAKGVTCQALCRAAPGSSTFDYTYREPITTTAGTNGSDGTAAGSDIRKRYCFLTYPKNHEYLNPTDTSHYVYYNRPGTLYSSSNYGTAFTYSKTSDNSAYSSQEWPAQTDSYNICTGKSGTADNNTGYSGCGSPQSFTPTDDDWALGFYDFGQRGFWYYTARTWYTSNSGNTGWLHTPVADNAAAILTKLGGDRTPVAFDGDEAGYVTSSSCDGSSANACSYVINAGTTPTEGTLQSAINYFNGTLAAGEGGTAATPIQYRCQKNFIVYVTDGLPSVSAAGTKGSAATLMPAVLTKLDNLLCPGIGATANNCKVTMTLNGTSEKFDVKTFVIGLGATPDMVDNLGAMATHGGTADSNGHALLASDSTTLATALDSVFTSILQKVGSGTAASVANNRGESGANMLRAIFYPRWLIDDSVFWFGEVQNLWYYLDPVINYSNIYEDTVQDGILNLQNDLPATSAPEDAAALWRAGVELQKRNTTTNPRKIYTIIDKTDTFSSQLNGYDLADGSSHRNDFADTNRTGLKPLLDMSTSTDADTTTMINYLRGTDYLSDSTCRKRTVTYGKTATAPGLTAVWPLGDIIDSTPQVQSSIPLQSYNTAYNDASYTTFIQSNNYKNHDTVYVGANDGMLHALKLGLVTNLTDPTKPWQIARISNPDTSTPLGSENWAFIPQNAMVYLKYLKDPNYCHVYFVDNSPLLLDASIRKTASCTASNYWDCDKKTTVDTSNSLTDETTWRTLLIGSMGLGGASRGYNATCNTTTGGLTDCVKSPKAGTGFSSYFAMDITDENAPYFKWEFSDAAIETDSSLSAADITASEGLGFTIPGPAIVRIAMRDAYGRVLNKNGRWFTVFASGSTGPIDTQQQFLGRSDQDLKLYVVDLNSNAPFKLCKAGMTTAVNGCNYWVKDTGKKFAFANSLAAAVIDTDRADPSSPGYYSDDVVYITYTKGNSDTIPTVWNKGGVLRLETLDDPDPNNWKMSDLITNIGPITSSVSKLQDRKNKKLWLFFGEGRSFYKNDSGLDDPGTIGTASRHLYGVSDPCYVGLYNDMRNTGCISSDTVLSTDIQIQDNSPASTLDIGKKGWSILLDAATTDFGEERVVSDPQALFNGVVFFTTFEPDTDICGFGGKSLLWAIKYDTGSQVPAGVRQGKAPIQTSYGVTTVIDLPTAFTDRNNRRIGNEYAPLGMPSKKAFPPLLMPKPVKKILHIMER